MWLIGGVISRNGAIEASDSDIGIVVSVLTVCVCCCATDSILCSGLTNAVQCSAVGTKSAIYIEYRLEVDNQTRG